MTYYLGSTVPVLSIINISTVTNGSEVTPWNVVVTIKTSSSSGD